MSILKIVALLSCFIILLVVISQTIIQAIKLNPFSSIAISFCVSALSVLGINQFLAGNIAPILIPYAAMGLAMIALLALLQLSRLVKSMKKEYGNLAEKEERPRNDERELR